MLEILDDVATGRRVPLNIQAPRRDRARRASISRSHAAIWFQLAGVRLTAWATPFVSSLLFGVAPRDPVMMVGAVVTLLVVGVAGKWLPVQRAARTDPASVLRES